MVFWQKLISIATIWFALALVPYVSGDHNASDFSCSANYTKVGNKCLQIVNGEINWYQSERVCRSMGANLISLQNSNELQQLNDWLNIVAPLTLSFWTSGNSLGQEGHYFWQSTGEQAQYLPWAKGHPVLESGNCIMLFANYTYANSITIESYGLILTNCLFSSPSICEVSPRNNEKRICLQPGTFEMDYVLYTEN